MIQQGHKYKFKNTDVIACEEFMPCIWWVRPIVDGWLGIRTLAAIGQLKPLPMKYFHGQIPK